jgi:hypothetical protein
MKTGQIISGAGHVGLIAWAVVGGAFRADPPPFEVREVTAISAEEFAALDAPQSRPEAGANVDTPETPAAGEAPSLAPRADAAPEVSRPEAAPGARPDTAPERPEPAPPARAEVGEAPPDMPAPQQDTAALVPEAETRQQPRQAPRVAPEPVAPPDPELRIDEVDRPETAPDDTAEPVEPEDDPAAREEATTEIVTEAEEPGAAPARSLRPRARPQRTAQEAPEREAPAPAEDADPSPEVDDTAVDDAVAAALGETGNPAETAEECWNVGGLGSEALATTVTVAFSLSRDGKLTATPTLVSATGGDQGAARVAFRAARSAIINCGRRGFDLPAGKYERWRDIEMTFNPENMRIK